MEGETMTQPEDLAVDQATRQKIIQDMLEQLRLAQGSGEYVPLPRRITAGEGLAGGGDLTEDRTLSLSQQAQDAIQAVLEADWMDRNAASASVEAGKIPVRDDLGNLQTGPPVQAGDAVPMGWAQEQVQSSLKMEDGGQGLGVVVRDLADHDPTTERPGVLYLLMED